MSRRAISKYLHLEAESGSEEDYDSSAYSEDLDCIVPVSRHPKTQRFEEMTQELETKYRIDSSEEEEVLTSEESVLEGPSQAQLLPTPKSPLLFLVRCKPGKEKNALLRILENVKSNEICSIVQKDGLKGYIYIESFKKQSIEDILAGLKNISRRKIGVVPYQEMVEAISYKKHFLVSEFARVKGGKYKGDLVQILNNYEDTVEARLVPRISEAKKYFDPAEYRNQYIERDGGYVYNRDFYKDGFLIKTMLKSSLDFEVDPTFEELESLRIKGSFNIGDKIRVGRGELTNFVGKIDHLSGKTATVSSDNMKYEVNVSDIEKFYTAGEEVSYNGINGIILKKEGNFAVIGINDLTDEIKCLVSDLKPPVPVKREFKGQIQGPRVRKDPLVNSRVIITHGKYKGLHGLVKDVYKDKCRVELTTSLEHINVSRSEIQFIEEKIPQKRRAIYSSVDSAQLGDAIIAKTPGYKTPGYQTPGYQTPGYKTPGYKTPGYQTPGYKTPGRIEGSNYFSRENEDPGTGWFMNKSVFDGIVVKISGSQQTVMDIKDNSFIMKSGENIAKVNVEYVVPEKYESAVVMEGQYKGTEVVLIGIKNDEGICRSTKSGEVLNLNLKDITKKI